MMNRQTELSRFRYLLIACFCLALLAACGGGDEEAVVESASSTPTAKAGGAAVPTMPSARFAQPTSVIDKSKLQDNESEDEGPDLELGERVYTKHCSECHGDDGTGVADKGGALAGTLTTGAEFDDLLRTGGQGQLGPTHLFGPTAISPSGMEALYEYTVQLVGP